MELTAYLDSIIAASRPVGNRVIHISISGLLSTDGDSLSGDLETFYFTAMDPFYSSTMRVRIIAGEFLEGVADNVIDQLIQYFSHEADLLNYRPEYSELNPETYRNYRSRWVTSSTVISLLVNSGITSMLQKRLGDFMVKREGPAKDLAKLQLAEKDRLERILQDGGNYGRDVRVAIKAGDHQDTPVIGRLWASPDIYPESRIPGANRSARFHRASDGRILRRSKKIFE